MVEQDKLSYRDNLEKYKPDFVVHGDDWKSGFQQPIREEVIEVLQSYGGRLIEFPYSVNETYEELEKRAKAELATPRHAPRAAEKAACHQGYRHRAGSPQRLDGLDRSEHQGRGKRRRAAIRRDVGQLSV